MGIFTSTGYQKESLAEWKVKIEDLFKEQFGEDTDLDPSGPFGQLVAITAKIATDQDEITEEVYFSRDPDSATGVSLDRICAETGTVRKAAGFTFIQDVLCYGDEGTALEATEVRLTLSAAFTPADDLYFALVDPIAITKTKSRKVVFTPDDPAASDSYTITINSIVYTVVADADPTTDEIITAMIAELPVEVTGTQVGTTLEIFSIVDFSFDHNGLWTLEAQASAGDFQSNTAGTITVPANSLTEIVTPVSGWDSANNPSAGEAGAEVETDVALRIRRREELISGKSTDNAIRIAVEKVANVSSASVFSNRALVTDASGIPAKAFEVVVLGGDEDEIAQAIYESAPAGIEIYGTNDLGTAIDPIDFTSEVIDFSRPTPVYIWARITRIPNTEEVYPADGDEQVKAAVVAWAEANLKQGTDVIRQRISIPVYTVPGSGALTIEIAKTATPGGTPVYAEADIVVLNRESAEMILTRIIMIEG